MTGTANENWGPGPNGSGNTGASGWASGPTPVPQQQPPRQAYMPQPPYAQQQPPYAAQQPTYAPQQQPPYAPQQSYAAPTQRQTQGAQPYSSFAPKKPTAPHAAPLPGSQPIGPARPDSLSIDTYKSPKRRVGRLIAFLVGFAVLIGGFIAIDHFARTAKENPSEVSSSASALPGLAFETSSASGSWEITKTQWSANRVALTVHVIVAKGSARFSFYAYNNAEMKVIYPDSTSDRTLQDVTVSAGESVSGTITISMSHGEGTLVLLDSYDRQVSGLPIKV